jgi:hypothetical protein
MIQIPAKEAIWGDGVHNSVPLYDAAVKGRQKAVSLAQDEAIILVAINGRGCSGSRQAIRARPNGLFRFFRVEYPC